MGSREVRGMAGDCAMVLISMVVPFFEHNVRVKPGTGRFLTWSNETEQPSSRKQLEGKGRDERRPAYDRRKQIEYISTFTFYCPFSFCQAS